MTHTPTRRHALATLAGVASTPIAGCASSTATDDAGAPGAATDSAGAFEYEALAGTVTDELPPTAATPDTLDGFDDPAVYEIVGGRLATVDVEVRRVGDGRARPPRLATAFGVVDTDTGDAYTGTGGLEIRPAGCRDCDPVTAAFHEPLHTAGEFRLPNAPSPETPALDSGEAVVAWYRTAVPEATATDALRPVIWPHGRDRDPVQWTIAFTAGESTDTTDTQ